MNTNESLKSEMTERESDIVQIKSDMANINALFHRINSSSERIKIALRHERKKTQILIMCTIAIICFISVVF